VRHIAWAASDVGRKREHNEDSLLVDLELGLFAVADGMGGHQGGDHASRMAIEVLHEEVKVNEDFEAAARKLLAEDPTVTAVVAREQLLSTTEPMLPIVPPLSRRSPALLTRWSGYDGSGADDPTYDDLSDMPTDPSLLIVPPAAATVLRFAARAAGRAIYDAAQVDAALAGMGTTLTAALFHKDRAHFAHVGDSRALLVRDGRTTQLTEDHSWIAEQVKAGILSESEARESKFRHIITRSVGFEREVDIDLFGVTVLPGDCFLLCSDGMTNYVGPDELARITTNTYYAKVPQLLIDLANDRGGDDNITVVFIYAANERQG
jgi:serine/threonine protein phosphatase PrpC